MRFVKADAVAFDIANLKQYTDTLYQRSFPLEDKPNGKELHRCKIDNMNNPREYYRCLAYWGSLFNDSLLIELGTKFGISALALSWNARNDVLSHDIVNAGQKTIMKDNITFRIKNVFVDKVYMRGFLESPFIFIDVQHDGPEEKVLLDFLIENEYKGITLWDDIYYNQPMKDFWQYAANTGADYNMHNLNNLRPGTGWGVIDFSKELEIV